MSVEVRVEIWSQRRGNVEKDSGSWTEDDFLSCSRERGSLQRIALV